MISRLEKIRNESTESRKKENLVCRVKNSFVFIKDLQLSYQLQL